MAVDIIVHPDPKRDAKALTIVDSVGSWPRIVLKQDFGAIPAGTVARRAPSSKGNGVTYRVCSLACECPDYQERGAVCYHVRALRLWEKRQATVAPTHRRPTLDELYPPCAAGCGDLVERLGESCYRCLSEQVRRAAMAARRVLVATGS